jgi:hypothetical protein
MITDPRLAWAGRPGPQPLAGRLLRHQPAPPGRRRPGPVTHGIDEAVREIESLAGKPGSRGSSSRPCGTTSRRTGTRPTTRCGPRAPRPASVVHTHSGEADMASYNENMRPVHAGGRRSGPTRRCGSCCSRASSTASPNLRYAPVECGSWWVGDLLFKTDVMFGRHELEGEEDGVPQTRGTIERLPSGVLRHQRVRRRSAMSKARDPPPLRQRRSTPSCGARLTRTPRAPGPTPRCGSPPTSARCRSRRPACCSGSTRCAATTSTSPR